jgi:sugar lactone lactonase YvrE
VSTTAERFTEPCTFHGEGPCWDAPNNRLLLVDMLAGALVAVDPEGDTRRIERCGVAAAIRARAIALLVLDGLPQSLGRIDRGITVHVVGQPQGQPRLVPGHCSTDDNARIPDQGWRISVPSGNKVRRRQGTRMVRPTPPERRSA